MRAKPAENPNTALKLTREDIDRMRASAVYCMYLEGLSAEFIGKMFRCTSHHINRMIREIPEPVRESIARSDERLRWRERIDDATGPDRRQLRIRRTEQPPSFSLQRRREMYARKVRGVDLGEIATAFGTTRGRVVAEVAKLTDRERRAIERSVATVEQDQ